MAWVRFFHPLLLFPLLAMGVAGCDSEKTKQVDRGNGVAPSGLDDTDVQYGNIETETVDSQPMYINDTLLNPPPARVSINNKAMAARRAKQVANILRASRKYGVEPELIHSIITQESTYKVNAISEAGAHGLMQLMPGTGARFGCSNRLEPVCNVNGGTAYLKFLGKRYSGNLQSVAAAYNAGEGTVDSYLSGVPDKEKTKNPGGIKTPNGVPLASFAYSAEQKARGCPRNNWKPTPDCEGQTYDYVRKVTGYYLAYKKNPQLIGLVSDDPSPSECDAREIC